MGFYCQFLRIPFGIVVLLTYIDGVEVMTSVDWKQFLSLDKVETGEQFSNDYFQNPDPFHTVWHLLTTTVFTHPVSCKLFANTFRSKDF